LTQREARGRNKKNLIAGGRKSDGLCWAGMEKRWRMLGWRGREMAYLELGRKRDRVCWAGEEERWSESNI